MPRNDANAPGVMTWRRALPTLLVAILFDLLRDFFSLFWLFGPGLLATFCTVYVSNSAVGQVAGTALSGTVCTSAAVAAGVVGVGLTTAFGAIMAMAVGLFGFLCVGIWLLVSNGRIFKAQAGGFLWMGGGLVVSAIPLIGALPALTTVVWRLYHTQIKADRAALKKYQASRAAAQLQERQAQEAQVLQIQAANDTAYAAQEAANDESFEEESTGSEQRRAA